ncbi:hypothetical protein CR161_00020, partial [Prosthecochloris sp. ZM]
FDGDTVNLGVLAGEGVSLFTVTVENDVPVQSLTEIRGIVEEEAIDNDRSSGNQDDSDLEGMVEDNDADNRKASGSLDGVVNVGADEEASYSLSSDTSSLDDQGLTSGNQALRYSVEGTTLTGYVESEDAEGLDDEDRVVFTLELEGTNNSKFTFTLDDQLDHARLDNEAGDDSENSLAIDLSGMIVATDGDGNSLVADEGSVLVTVQDDIPALSIDTQTGEAVTTGGVVNEDA